MTRAAENFTIKTYKKLFIMRGVSDFFKVLKISGVTEDLIDQHPIMKLSKERYLEAVDSIINFPKTKQLLQ